jgi:glutamate dehydrogenase/leucine dehydrogenase
MRFGNRLEDYVASKEPRTRSEQLLTESAARLKIPEEAVQEIVKPYTVYIQRLPVMMLGVVVNIMSGIVLHNRARGPYKGGIRIAPDVDLWETNELARLMTLKTALAGVELGGGKSGISVDLRALHKHMVEQNSFNGPFREFEPIAKADIMGEFTSHFGWLFKQHIYVPAPDMGTSGREMVAIYNDTRDGASVTGKPAGIEGWLPGREESTGFGVAYSILTHMRERGVAPDQCTASLQGFGQVGSHAAIFLAEQGVRIVGVTDMTGGVQDEGGIDVVALKGHCSEAGCVGGFNEGDELSNEQLFQLEVDYFIPAASGHVVHAENADTVGAKVVVEAANMPVTYDAMRILQERGVEIIPDTYANAGGVIASNAEFRQAMGGEKFGREDTLAYVRKHFDQMHEEMKALMTTGRTMLEASTDIALQRVYETMQMRSLL